MWHYIERTFRQIDTWGGQEWLVALVIALVIGFVCLRGFTSWTKF